MFEMKSASKEEFNKMYPYVPELVEPYKCAHCFDNKCVVVILDPISRKSQTIECIYCKEQTK